MKIDWTLHIAPFVPLHRVNLDNSTFNLASRGSLSHCWPSSSTATIRPSGCVHSREVFTWWLCTGARPWSIPRQPNKRLTLICIVLVFQLRLPRVRFQRHQSTLEVLLLTVLRVFQGDVPLRGEREWRTRCFKSTSSASQQEERKDCCHSLLWETVTDQSSDISLVALIPFIRLTGCLVIHFIYLWTILLFFSCSVAAQETRCPLLTLVLLYF